MKKEYHFGYEAHYHHEGRLLPENATFGDKFQLLPGKPLLAYFALSYICFVFGGETSF